MVKDLKKRFVLITMMIVGIIVLTIFSAFCVLTYKSQMQQTVDFLKQEINSPYGSPHEGDRLPVNSEVPPALPGAEAKDEFFELPNIYTFKAWVDKEGNITDSSTESTDIEKASLENAVNKVLSSKNDSGRVKGASLIYYKKATQGGTIIIFTSSKPVDSALSSTVLICLFLCVAALLLFFILAERLAHYATKPVEQAWESQKQFIADASHDLKTPLTVILANNDILLSHKSDTVESQEKWIESTNEEALKMKGLVTQMLDLAKAESVNKTVSMERTNLSVATEGEILQLESVAFEKQLKFNISIKENVITTTNLEVYLRIAQALLDNAIKYSPPLSEIKVWLWEERQSVHLSVTNRALLSREDMAHIFERFYRGDKTRGDGGHGLGLSIAKNLALSINGDLRVKSNCEGTTFTLTLKKK